MSKIGIQVEPCLPLTEELAKEVTENTEGNSLIGICFSVFSVTSVASSSFRGGCVDPSGTNPAQEKTIHALSKIVFGGYNRMSDWDGAFFSPGRGIAGCACSGPTRSFRGRCRSDPARVLLEMSWRG